MKILETKVRIRRNVRNADVVREDHLVDCLGRVRHEHAPFERRLKQVIFRPNNMILLVIMRVSNLFEEIRQRSNVVEMEAKARQKIEQCTPFRVKME